MTNTNKFFEGCRHELKMERSQLQFHIELLNKRIKQINNMLAEDMI